MIARDYRLTLTGRQSNTVYVERYFATMEEAMVDYDNICRNSTAVFKTIPEDTLIARIDELAPTNMGMTYIDARMDWMFRDNEEPTDDKKV